MEVSQYRSQGPLQIQWLSVTAVSQCLWESTQCRSPAYVKHVLPVYAAVVSVLRLYSCCAAFATCSISNDVGSELTYLEILNEEEASRFRPRLSENKALLPVKLKLTGPDGLPGAAAVQVNTCAVRGRGHVRARVRCVCMCVCM